MSIKTFWILILKIIGLWLLLDVLQVIVNAVGTALLSHNDVATDEYLLYSIVPIVVALLFLGIVGLLLFRPMLVVEKLDLDKHFEDDERLEFNIGFQKTIVIASIVIGGILFLNNLPHLCLEVFSFIKQKNIAGEASSDRMFIYFVKTVIGYLFVTNSKAISDFIVARGGEPKE